MHDRSRVPAPAPCEPASAPDPSDADGRSRAEPTAGQGESPLPADYEPSAEDWNERELFDGYLEMMAERAEEAGPPGGTFGIPAQESDYR